MGGNLLRCTTHEDKAHLFIHQMKLDNSELLATGNSKSVCIKSVDFDIGKFINNNAIELIKVPCSSHSWIEYQNPGENGLQFYEDLIQLHNASINQSVII